MPTKKKEPMTAADMGRLRWKGVKKKERSRILTEIGKKGGRPRSADRCPCGTYTIHTAKLKHHHCEPTT